MSMTLDDLEELEAMSEFSDFSGSSESGSDHAEWATGSSSINSSGSDSEARDSESDSDVDASNTAAGDAEAADSAYFAGRRADYDSDGDSVFTDSEDTGGAVGDVAGPAKSGVQMQMMDEAVRQRNHVKPNSVEVTSDHAIEILAKTPFARSKLETDRLLEWVLSVRFFQESARSSFVREYPSSRICAAASVGFATS